MKTWSMLTKMDTSRSWESNEGYADVLGSRYLYDSGVANHLQVSVGDVVVLRDAEVVLGISRVDHIDSKPGKKLRKICPRCERTGFVARKNIEKTGKKAYLCRHPDCRLEFDAAKERNDDVTLYVASYGATWQSLDGAIPYDPLEALLDGAQQNAIRTCESDGLALLLDHASVRLPDVQTRSTVPIGGHRTAMVRVRNGQRLFRRTLLQRDGLVCAVTGPCPEAALEAAHLRAFAVHETHDPHEGMLLRSDIHQLFDRGLIAVDPETMTIVTCPSLEPYEYYRGLQGTPIKAGPSVQALADHHREAASAWKDLSDH